MGTWTQELLDVTTSPGGPGVAANADGDTNLARLERKLTELGRRVLAAGGTGQTGALYFPPGRYRIGLPPLLTDEQRTAFRRRPFLASLVIPPNVELYMAPNAVLLPERGCVIDIQGALTCDGGRVFDLGLGGLVVFGQGVEAVRPEWWGTGTPALDTAAVQAAFDAAIHNRRSFGLGPTGTAVGVQVRPPLPVALRGRYQIERPLVIDGGVWTDVLEALHPTLRGARPSTPAGGRPLLRSLWTGRSRQGASLVAANFRASAQTSALLRLERVSGVTLEGIAFDARATSGLGCVKIDADPAQVRAITIGVAHDITFRRCRFQGRGRGPSLAMVEVDAPLPASRSVELSSAISPPDLGVLTFPLRPPSRMAGDATGLTLADCEFEPAEGASAVLLRANQTLPMVLRESRFVGDSLAMVDLWGGTTLAEDCVFNNQRIPAADPQPVTADLLRRTGFEEPEGTDFYLRFEAISDLAFPRLVGTEADIPVGPALFPRNDLLPAVTAFRCTSRSRRTLSTTIPYPWMQQHPGWPSLLLDHRHVPPDPPAGAATGLAAVLWGMHNRVGVNPVTGAQRLTQRMGFAAPLVLLNGQYAGPLRIYNGAVQCAVIGSRDRAGARLGVTVDPRVTGLTWNTDIYGLRFDQALTV